MANDKFVNLFTHHAKFVCFILRMANIGKRVTGCEEESFKIATMLFIMQIFLLLFASLSPPQNYGL